MTFDDGGKTSAPAGATYPRPSPGERLRAGALAGVVAASATAGALIAFGARRGDALRAFVALGRVLLAGPPVAGPQERLAVAFVGLLLHVAAVVVWGLVFGTVAHMARGGRLFLLACLVALVAWATNSALALTVLRPGHDLTALTPQRGPAIVLYLVLALGLWLGMRVALPWSHLDERTR